MQRVVYPAVIERGAQGFGVFFPDLPGCASAADTFSEAIVNAHEALALHIAGFAEDKLVLPTASALNALPPLPQGVEIEAIILVGATVPSGRATEVSIALDEALLRDIDAATKDRSRFLADAARAELARRAGT